MVTPERRKSRQHAASWNSCQLQPEFLQAVSLVTPAEMADSSSAARSQNNDSDSRVSMAREAV